MLLEFSLVHDKPRFSIMTFYIMLGLGPPSIRKQWAILYIIFTEIKNGGFFYRLSKIVYNYFIYTGILFFCLFRNIGYGGGFSFHKIFEMLLLFRDDNHVQKSSISLDIIQLVENVILGRRKRGGNSLTVKSFGSLYNSSLQRELGLEEV